jgi:hypothetical protein
MIYFIQVTDGLKIGRSKVPESRLRTAITWGDPRLLMTLETPNDKKAEAMLHEHFAAYRIGEQGKERFAISLHSAVAALVSLRLLGSGQQVLEMQEIPGMHSDFPSYLHGIWKTDSLSPARISDAWANGYSDFLAKREVMSLEEMIRDY